MRAITSIIHFSVYRPRLVIGFYAVLFACSIVLAGRVELKTSNLDLINPQLPEVSSFMKFAGRFGNPNVLVVALKGGREDERKRAVDRLAPRFRNIPGVRRVLAELPVLPDLGNSSLGVAELKPGRGYLSSRDGASYYVFVQPEDIRSSVDALSPVVEAVREELDGLESEIAGLSAGLSGIPKYAIDDRDVIQRDISFYSLLSLGLILLLFITAFAEFRRPALATGVLVVSVAITIGATSFAPGHLTLLSASFATIIFGLGIDYGIHIISLIEERITEGSERRQAIEESLVSLLKALSAAALTTIGVFFVLLFSGFRGFEELGLIAGSGILICFIVMYTLLPACLSLFDSGKAPGLRGNNHLGAILLFFQTKWFPPFLFAISVLPFVMPVPSFDSNYLNLQPADSEAVRIEREMIESSDYSPYFAAFTLDSIEEVSELVAKLKKDDSVGAIRSIMDVPREILANAPSADLLEDLGSLFKSDDGKYAVYAYPSHNIWDPKVERQFLSSMRELDSNVTGMPFLGSLMVSRSKEALAVTAQLAILVLLLVVLLHFRNIYQILLTITSPLLAILWTMLGMSLLGVTFNPINVMALPIIIGIAVDDSVHIVHRFVEERGDISRTLRGTGRSVLLTTLTTLAAFGSLTLSSHLGLRSLCLVLCLGVASALVISVVILPWLLLMLKRLVLAK